MIKRREWLAGAAALAGAVTGARGAAGHAAAAAAPVRAPALRRGLNLTHWFEYERAQSLNAAEFRHLRHLGFDHVRLPLDPLICGWQPHAGGAVLPVLPELRGAVDDAVRAGLAVVIDLHLEPSDKERIEASDEGQAAVVALWQLLAREMAGMPVQAVAFELFNEPQFYGLAARRWEGFQLRMLQAVRAHASQHLVLLSGNQGASPEGLQRLKPVSDAHVGYVFHTYAPYLFTHQGAHWMDTRYTTAGLHHGVRYPAALQRGHGVRLSRPHPRAAKELDAYVGDDWGPSRVVQEIRPAAEWARRHGVRVVCNEFGVLRASADPASRYRWIADVRQALEAEGIGWTLWDYTDIFGITEESALPGHRGARHIEPEALAALGMSAARGARGAS